MGIITLKFFMFVALVLVTYYFCLPKYRWVVLLGASIGFFLSNSSLALLLVFCAMSILTWTASLIVYRVQSEKLRTALVATVITALALVLILYKEIAFVINNVNFLSNLAGLDIGLTLPEWVAPLGISYYTLILIGYLLDVRWGTVSEPEKNPLKFLLFAGYFPQMTSGPFTRYNEMKETLFCGPKFKLKNLWFGVQRIVWGVFKVLVISTRLSVIVSTIYDAQSLPAEENVFIGIGVVAGALLYVLNVYVNFSGSMDILLGVSEMLGVSMPENFDRPFSATNLSEVWRKWHITLGLWLKDYVMYPTQKTLTSKFGQKAKKAFGKKAGKDILLYASMLVVWFCVGFWHGGSWKYICGSGLFFFVMIVGGLILKPVFQKAIKILHIHTECDSWRLFQRFRTIFLFSLSVSFGRASSLTAGFAMWKNAFSGANLSIFSRSTILNMGLTLHDLAFLAVGLVIFFTVSHLQEHYGSVREWLRKQNVLFQILIFGALLSLTVLIGGLDNKVDFIYGNF